MIAGFRKAWADLRAGWGQTTLAIAALALGSWGVSSVLIANVILRADLRGNFLETRPAHAVLVSTGFKALDVSELTKLETVEAMELRDFALMRIEVHPNDWIPIWLFGVKDFLNTRVAAIRPQTGAFPPPPGSMLIERDAKNISDLDTGKDARVRTSARLIEVPVSGVAFDPAQAPATQDHFIYAYVDQPTFAAVTGTAANRRLLVRFKSVASRGDVLARLKDVERLIVERGIALESMEVPDFEAHPHQWQLDTLLLIQGSIGLLALLTGLVLVSQLMAAMLAKQTRQIAVLKAIGATRGQLLRIYVLMLALLGLAAALIAIPLALWTGTAFSHFVGGRLNFNIHDDNLPNVLLFVLAATSLALPVLASLGILRRAMNAPVKDGLSNYGVASGAGRSPAWMRLPDRVPGTVALALRNAVRQRQRAFVTVLMMALGVAIFDTGFNVRQSLANMLQEFRQGMTHDVQLVLDGSTEQAVALAPFRDVQGIASFEAWNGGRGELQRQVVSSNSVLGVVALPRHTKLFHPRLIEGRWLGQTSAVPEVVLNQQAAQAFGKVKPGDEVTLAIEGRRIESKQLVVRWVGVIEDLDRPKVYIDRDDFDRAVNPLGLINSVMFVSEKRDYASVLQLKQDIEGAAAKSNLEVLYVMAQAERVKIIADHLDIVLLAIGILSLPVLVVSAFGMASATGINVQERTREIGVLRAIGATPRTILRLITMEGLTTSTVSVMLGLLIAQPLSGVASVLFGRLMLGEGATLRYAFSLQGFAIAACTTLLFGLMASRIPARTALRTTTQEALDYN
jgi:putative ABC transport system permease protein